MTATLSTIMVRGGAAAVWTAANPVLALCELGVETDTKKFKLGDGSTAWNSLAYAIVPITSIVGITGTKAEFNTAVTDGDILFVGDVTSFSDEAAQDAVGAMVDASLVYVDATPLLTRAALTGDATAPQGSNTLTLATVNSNTGTYGGATTSPQISVNGKGLITGVSAVTITPAFSSLTSVPTTLAGHNITLTSGNVTTALGYTPVNPASYGTGVATALGVNVGSAGAFVTFNGAGGTPSSLTLTNATGLPTAGLANDAVTYAKMQNVSAQYRLIGRSTAGAGDPEEIASSANVFTMLGSADNAAIRSNIGLGSAATMTPAAILAQLADPTQPIVEYDDFHWTQNLGWITSNFTANAAASVDNHPGIVRYQTSAVATTICSFFRGQTAGANNDRAVDDTASQQWIFREDAAGVTDLDVRVGLMDAMNVNPPVNGIYLEKLAADTTWFLVARTAGVQTRTNTTIASQTTAWINAKLTRDSSTQWSVTISSNAGTPVTVSVAANVPAGSVIMDEGMMAIPTTNNARSMRVDFYGFVGAALTR